MPYTSESAQAEATELLNEWRRTVAILDEIMEATEKDICKIMQENWPLRHIVILRGINNSAKMLLSNYRQRTTYGDIGGNKAMETIKAILSKYK